MDQYIIKKTFTSKGDVLPVNLEPYEIFWLKEEI
jgi:hypothetical protein